MLVYWLMFGIFAAAALLWSDQSPVTQHAHPGSQPGPAPRRFFVPLITGLFLIVIVGLRYRVGGDWSTYQSYYDYAEYVDLSAALARSPLESGYTLINWISARMGGGIGLVNVVCAIPFVVGLIRLSERSGNAALALTVATPFLIIVVGMGYTRQAAALGFLMIGLVELIEKKSLVRFIIYVVIGSFLHQTILIFIPIMLVSVARNFVVKILLAGLAAPIAYLTLVRASLDQYSVGYIESDLDAGGATVRVIMNLLPAVILLLSGTRLFRSVEEQFVWRAFAVLALFATAALFVVQSSVIVDRLSIYLIPLQLFVYTRLTAEGAGASSSSFAWRALIVLYSATVLFVWLNYAVNAFAWIPYRNFIFEGG